MNAKETDTRGSASNKNSSDSSSDKVGSGDEMAIVPEVDEESGDVGSCRGGNTGGASEVTEIENFSSSTKDHADAAVDAAAAGDGTSFANSTSFAN